jgi:hypothetical protein
LYNSSFVNGGVGMRRVLFFTAVILLYITLTPNNSSEHASSQISTLKNLKEVTPIYPHPEIKDQQLIKGSIHLVETMKVHQLYEVGPINLTIQSIKKLHVSPDNNDPGYNVLIIDWEILNTAEEDFFFIPITGIEMRSGGSIKIFPKSISKDVKGWGTKTGTSQFIMELGQNANLHQITILTSDIRNVNNRKLVNREKCILK